MGKSTTESVTVTKKPSGITIILNRSTGAPGSVQITGVVYTDMAPYIIAGVSAELWVDGVKVATATTDSYLGAYVFNYTVAVGTHRFQTKWAGNVTYLGAESSSLYGVYGKVGTSFYGLDVKPLAGAAPLAVTILVQLRRDDTGLGLNGKTVSLYRNNALIKSMTTASTSGGPGFCLFQDTLTAAGEYQYYVYFAGDSEFEGCEDDESESLPCTICGHPISCGIPGSEVVCLVCHSVFETVIV